MGCVDYDQILGQLHDAHHALLSGFKDEKWDELPSLVEKRGVLINQVISHMDDLSSVQVSQVKDIFSALLTADEQQIEVMEALKASDKALLLKLSASRKASQAYNVHQK